MTRYHDPHPSWTHDELPPADLREFQERFDAEHEARGFGPAPTKHLRSHVLPFLFILCLALWTVFGMWLAETVS